MDWNNMDRTTLDTQFHRQLDIIHPDKLDFPITIIGAGASIFRDIPSDTVLRSHWTAS